MPLAMRLLQGTRERCRCGIEVGDQKRHQVGGGRAQRARAGERRQVPVGHNVPFSVVTRRDRKSTRLNSSHLVISYAVFCLKKKKQTRRHCISRYMSIIMS